MKATVQILCHNCGAPIPHNYLREDLHENNKELKFECPNCGTVIVTTSAKILDKTKEEIIKILKRKLDR